MKAKDHLNAIKKIDKKIAKADRLPRLRDREIEALKKRLDRHPDEITPGNSKYARQSEVTRFDLLDLG